jgi:flavin-dependent dehydrogenase
MPLEYDCDVLVIGGGPAGSTVATMLARHGWRVTLVEKDRHPRFHIGESLLPMNVPIFERLGVLDQVRAIGVKKMGADFPAPNRRGYNVFRFARTLTPGSGHAFQVRRAELDELLFRHAAASGVTVMEGVKVERVELNAHGATARLAASAANPPHTGTLRAAYLVDASGRDTVLASQLGLKRRHPRHQSAAIFAHFSGVGRRPGDDAGNISIYRFAHGWIWLIPLAGDCTSIGAVCFPQYLKQRTGSQEEFLMRTLDSVPSLASRMKNARVIGHLQATGNYSYVSRRISGRRWVMAGDAYAFLDPIFSSGVYLAMHGAECAAALVDAVLRQPRRERSLQRRYAREVQRGLGLMSWFIFRFTSPVMEQLFGHPRNVLRMEEAMISMLAGDVFHNRGVRWRLAAFKLIYYTSCLGHLRQALSSLRERRRQARVSMPSGTGA